MDAERARLFVALELCGAARDALVRWRTHALAEMSALRAVAPEALHATLCFLGWRSVDEIEQIGAACAAAVGGSPAPPLALAEALWLPARRPRVVAVALEDRSGNVAGVQASLSGALAGGGWYEPEARPFLAHVTVARVAGRARVRPVELAALAPLAFDPPAVTLYRSWLERAGARYEALRRVPFV